MPYFVPLGINRKLVNRGVNAGIELKDFCIFVFFHHFIRQFTLSN